MGDLVTFPGDTTCLFPRAQTPTHQVSAPSALDATYITTRHASLPHCGMESKDTPVEILKESSSRWPVPSCVLIGNSHVDVPRTIIQTDISAQDVVHSSMGHKIALTRRRNEALTPYRAKAWDARLKEFGLVSKYPSLARDLCQGFNLGIPYVYTSYTPPNNPSAASYPSAYKELVDKEFAAGRYLEPFTKKECEELIGIFHSSPLSFIPKSNKHGKYCVIHDFSHPHTTSRTSSINSFINIDNFPCTWGTFATVYLTISCLPPNSQASVRDIAEAY